MTLFSSAFRLTKNQLVESDPKVLTLLAVGFLIRYWFCDMSLAFLTLQKFLLNGSQQFIIRQKIKSCIGQGIDSSN